MGHKVSADYCWGSSGASGAPPHRPPWTIRGRDWQSPRRPLSLEVVQILTVSTAPDVTIAESENRESTSAENSSQGTIENALAVSILT